MCRFCIGNKFRNGFEGYGVKSDSKKAGVGGIIG